MAETNPKAVAESERIDKARKIAARSVELGLDGHVAEMIAEIRLRIEDSGLTQSEVAARCGWPASLLSGYHWPETSGDGEPCKAGSHTGFSLADDSGKKNLKRAVDISYPIG